MRLETLELVRYGHFDDRRLEFRKSTGHGASTDLQIIYGPNEAGKSTIREAISDLLFKVPTRSQMKFAAKDVLKVGARVQIGENHVQAYRLKKLKDDLVDDKDRPLSDNPFAVVTDGFDRSGFEQTFSVNRDQLEDGGKSILEGSGDLGRLLFAGTTGLQGLPERLVELDTRASAIWSRKADASARALTVQIKEIDDRIKALRTSQKAYNALRATVDEKSEALECVKTSFQQTNAAIKAIEGKLAAFKPYRDRARDIAALEQMGDGAIADEQERDRLIEIFRVISGLDGRIEDRREKQTRLRQETAQLPDADPISAHHAAIEDLVRRATTIRDRRDAIPNRRADQEKARETIARILRELDVSADGDEIETGLSAKVRARLADLLKSHTERAAALLSAEREVAEARRKSELAQETLAGLEDVADPAALKAHLKAAGADDLTAEHRNAVKAVDGIRERIAASLDGVGLAAERADWLSKLDLPQDEDLDHLQRRLENTRSEVTRLQSELRQRKDAHADATEQIEALGDLTDVSDESLTAARATRDEVVAALRGELSEAETNDLRARLEASIGETDRIFEDRIQHADRLSSVNNALLERDRQSRARERLSKELEAFQDGLAKIEAEIAAYIPADTSTAGLSGLRKLVETRKEVADALRELQVQTAEVSRITAITRERAGILRAALFEAGQQPSEAATLDILQILAADHVQALEDARRTRDAAAKAQAEAGSSLARRETALTHAQSAFDEATQTLKEVLGETWIPSDNTPEQVGAILNRLPELSAARADLQSANRRLEQIHDDQRAAEKQLADFLEISGLEIPDEFAGADFVLIIDHLKERLETAKTHHNRNADLNRQITDFGTEIAALEQETIDKRSEVADLVERFGTQDLGALMPLVRDGVTRKDLQSAITEREREILEALGGTVIDDALAFLNGSDEASLRAEKEGLEADLGQIITARDEARSALTIAQSELGQMSGSDEIARLAQEREILAAELVEQLGEYMRLRAGEKALNWALTRYRQDNKAPMLDAAGRFFARMTAGRYPELITQAGDKGDILVAREDGGGLKGVDALSEGTRHQLFLSLRMAGYLELASGRQAPPLILDDILSSSDNDRTGAMLEALADLAETVQVIVLTHHAHVLTIAEDAVPGRHAVVRLNAL
jgi:uncharacterized protein YhaN